MEHNAARFYCCFRNWLRYLCAYVGGIIVGGIMTSEAFTHGHGFPDSVVANRIGFLLQYRFGALGVVDNGHIVPVNVRGT